MLFKELKIKDFLSFKGLNKIVFPNVEKSDSSLVLVLAANNSGKTNMLKALQFLLYGDTLGLQQEKTKLINNVSLNEAKSDIHAWVEATIIDDNVPLTIRRELYAIRSGKHFSVNQMTLCKIIHEPKGDKFITDEGAIQRKIEMLVPRELFDYFYFQGEELAKQLMTGTSKTNISSGIFKLLHVDDWNQAMANVSTVKQAFLNNLKSLDSANREYKIKLESYENFENKEKDCAEELRKTISQKETVKEELENIYHRLKKISDGKPKQQRTDLLRKYRSELSSIQSDINNYDAQICKEIGDSKGVFFLSGAFESVNKVLKKMQGENLLPADLTDGFVERLLRNQHCICGRPLHPKTDKEACEYVSEYRKRSLSADLNSGLLELLGNLDANANFSYLKKMLDAKKSLNTLIEKRDKCIVNGYKLTEEIQALETELSDPVLGEIAELVEKQKEFSDREARLQSKIHQLDRDLMIHKKKTAELAQELKKLAKTSPHMKEEQIIQKCHTMAKNLEELIRKSREDLRNSFYHIMQSSVSEYYDNVVTDNTKAFIDKESLLPAIQNPQGEVVKHIGGGQRQLLVMTHIISLCKLRKELHQQLNDFGIIVGKLDDQSFFFDSIFAPTDDVYSRRIAELLCGKARQVVLLLASQQWHDNIRNAIEPYVDRAYRILLNTQNTALKNEEYMVKYNKQNISLINLIKDEKDSKGAFSNIEEIR